MRSPGSGTEIVLAPADAGRLCKDAGLQHLSRARPGKDCLAGANCEAHSSRPVA
jgi:hypothetical protein